MIDNFHLCLNTKTELATNLTFGDRNVLCDLVCTEDLQHPPDCVTGTLTFWSFVLLMSLGTIGFNVANCVSDATCFDMLGKKKIYRPN